MTIKSSMLAIGLFALLGVVLLYLTSKDNKKLVDMKGKAVMKATFAGGCFWCMQPVFKLFDGIDKVEAGYTGGKGENPTYEDYAQKGHVEAIQVTYDPKKVSYEKLLQVFWRQINPTDAGGQFVDRGAQYRSVVFYHDDMQKKLAEKSKEDLEKTGRFDKKIVTEILPASTFYPAEEYHQDYSKKNWLRYKLYRFKSGRDQFLKKIWSKEDVKQDLKNRLTPIQYNVTQKNATEPAFNNKYWDNKRPGIYVDIVSGEPLFTSTDKFASGTGWPSFSKPLEKDNVVLKKETGFFRKRIEVRSKKANSHLGHLFYDGPKPTGMRYCINSASLRFIPVEDLEKEGFGQYKKLFKKKR